MIDIDRLAKDLKQELFGACFGGEFGGALIELDNIQSATPEEIIDFAGQFGINLNNYKMDDDESEFLL